MLFLAERYEIGRLGGDPAAPHIRSRRSRLEKAPWRDLPGLEGRVEAEFLRSLYLGESIAPYRLVDPPLAVIPWDAHRGRLLDRDGARAAGYLHLAAWLTEVEDLWTHHGKRQEPITPRLDYFHQLSAQMPLAPVRVVYAASGTQPAAAVLRGAAGVVEHKLYWAAVAEDEGLYLAAILNSETARSRVAHLQSRGQWGARDFDKVVFELPIPAYDPSSPLHAELAATAKLAEGVAAAVVLPPSMHFVRARSLIREALVAQGIAQTIEALVGTLLAGGSEAT